MSPKLRILLPAFVVSLFLDQLTKVLVDTHFHFGTEREVIEGFFYLTHVRNQGAAFGMGANLPDSVRLGFFYVVSVLAIGIIISFYRKLAPGDRLSALALGLILGGAVGNLVDRVRFGEVVDFLHFKLWQGYSWPDFNLADSFIVTGVALLVLEVVATEGDDSSPSETA